MKYFTQSRLAPHGNCWQTAVACILGVDPECLPPQSDIESWDSVKVLDGWGAYRNCLQGYLRKHHNLMYTDIYAYEFACVRPIREEIVMCGPSPRTEAHRAAGIASCDHCVVGVNGVAVWDPHPSRAGLLEVTSRGVMGPYIPPTKRQEIERLEFLDKRDRGHALVFGCLCPSCPNLYHAQQKALQVSLEPKPEAAG